MIGIYSNGSSTQVDREITFDVESVICHNTFVYVGRSISNRTDEQNRTSIIASWLELRLGGMMNPKRSLIEKMQNYNQQTTTPSPTDIEEQPSLEQQDSIAATPLAFDTPSSQTEAANSEAPKQPDKQPGVSHRRHFLRGAGTLAAVATLASVAAKPAKSQDLPPSTPTGSK